ncbi:MAG: hypothetical protein VX078_00920, partial [Pseudomonadota bacterium]|nr:hypothetical protein [Pseudomonadota bacterium]
ATTTKNGALELTLHSDGSYIGMPKTREVTYVVHGLSKKPRSASVNDKAADMRWDDEKKTLSVTISSDYQQEVVVTLAK